MMPETATPSNRLLAALPKSEYSRLFPKLDRIPLTYNENIYEPGGVIKHVYFPESGIISLLSRVDGDSTLEVGIVGTEGMAGLPVFLGVNTSTNRAVVQGAGHAMKVSISDFNHACEDGNTLPRFIRRYVHSLFTQISQAAACNRFHQIESRLARWLLMTQDRMQDDEFQITQDFLSHMLGVRREAVNKAAGGLQRSKLISYKRGNMTINDRRGLEKIACPCYKLIKKEYDAVSS